MTVFESYRRCLTWSAVPLLALFVLLAGCTDESLLASEATDARFQRYVALGNSITAGFQADGINRTLQE